MSRSFMAPLQTFTLESLIALEQWAAVQAGSRRKGSASGAKTGTAREFPRRDSRPKKGAL